MRLYLLLLLIGYSFSVLGQDYDDADIVFELIGEHAEMSEFFERRAFPFTIDQYVLNEQTDSLDLLGGCLFSFLDNEIIQTCAHKKNQKACKKKYWRWFEDKDGEKFGYIEECNKKGVVKRPWLGFETTESTIVNLDSIVDQTSWWVSKKGDTTCHFLERWIYRNDTLVEYWHDDNWQNDCSFTYPEKFARTRYIYPSPNTTLTESIPKDGSESLGKYRIVKTFDREGNLTCRFSEFVPTDSNYCHTHKCPKFETKYFRKEGFWFRTESWVDGKLTEIILKTTNPNNTYAK